MASIRAQVPGTGKITVQVPEITDCKDLSGDLLASYVDVLDYREISLSGSQKVKTEYSCSLHRRFPNQRVYARNVFEHL